MSPELVIFLFIIAGLISGLLAGLLGIGGGVITVPFLYFMFLHSDLPHDRVMQIAVSTSLAAAFITSIISTAVQLRKKAILMSIMKLKVPTLILGCIAGSLIAHYLPSLYLRMVFGGMAMILGIYFCFPKLPTLYIAPEPNHSLRIFSLVIGVISSMLGIGGGSIAFPILLAYQIPARNASAISSACTLVTTLFGSLTFQVLAWQEPHIPLSLGYIELPAFLAISFGALFSTPLGVKLSYVLPISQIKKVFGICLLLVGLAMVLL